MYWMRKLDITRDGCHATQSRGSSNSALLLLCDYDND
jgi:hypothetical protein